MKKCPRCGRNYDVGMAFCLDDGAELVYGPATTGSVEPATAILHPADAVGDALARTQIHPTEQTAVLPSESTRIPKRGLEKRLLALPFLLAIIMLGGFYGYRYFNPAVPNQINSIAVLPFENRSGNADSDYLSDGIAESLIYRLTQLPNLKVSPTSSVVRYKGKDLNIAEIAKELEVDAVMSGRLVQRGDSLVISVELIDARTKKLLWGEQYDRKMSDLLATQREIAATITQKLQLKLSDGEKGLAKKYTDSNDAYQLYLKGRFHFAKRTKVEILQGINEFQQAIKLDPNFALAFVSLAEAYSVMPSFPYMSPHEAIPKAKLALARALEIDPDLAEAHAVAGVIAAYYDWKWAESEREFKRALELDPNLAIAHFRYGWLFLSPMGRHEEAIAEMKRSLELEPVSLIQGSTFVAVYLYARQYDLAEEQAKKTLNLDPGFFAGYTWLCHTYSLEGKYSESIPMAEKSLQTPNPLYADAIFAYAKTGRRAEAEGLLQRWKEVEKSEYVLNYWMAIAHVALGNKDAAFVELEKAYQAHDWFLPRLKVDPFMDPLRDDPRFADLVKRIGLPQ